METRLKKFLIAALLLCSLPFAFAEVPGLTVVQPNGGQFLSGRDTIQFSWFDANDPQHARVDANLYLSENPLDFDNLIVKDLNLVTLDVCDNFDNNQFTPQNCFFDWNTDDFADGNYFLDIVIKDDQNNLALDSSDASFVVDNTAPNRPTGFTASRNDRTITLNWSAASDSRSGIKAYRIYRNISDINTQNQGDSLLKEISSTQAFDTITFGFTFHYRITAVDKAGNESTLSDEAVVSTPTEFIAPFSSLDENLLVLDPAFETINTGERSMVTILFGIENNSGTSLCADLKGATTSSLLGIELSKEQLCLNPEERKFFNVNLETFGAPSNSFLAYVIAESGEFKRTSTLLVRTGVGERVSVNATTQSVCRGEHSTIPVRVRNNSFEPIGVDLRAASTLSLPAFEDQEIELDGFQERFVNLDLFVYKDANISSLTVSLFAQAGSSLVQKNIAFTVRDCAPVEEQKFVLDTQTTCPQVQKEGITALTYSLENRKAEALEVSLALLGDLNTTLPALVRLEPREKRIFSLLVKPKLSDAAGTHNMELVAWTGFQRSSKPLCVSVQGRNASEVGLLVNQLQIEEGKNGVFTLFVRNSGDFSQSYSLRFTQVPATVQLSDSSFVLGPGQEKQVFVSVTPNPGILPGDYGFDVLVSADTVYRQGLSFRLVESKTPEPGPAPGALVLASYPQKMDAPQSSQIPLGILVTNTSGQSILGVNVHVSGLPAGIDVSQETIDLAPGETKEVVLTARIGNVEPGAYTGRISAEKGVQVSQASFTLNVIGQGGLAGLTGFLGLAGGLGLGLLILAAVFLLAYYLYRQRETETWARKW